MVVEIFMVYLFFYIYFLCFKIEFSVFLNIEMKRIKMYKNLDNYVLVLSFFKRKIFFFEKKIF